MLKNHFGEDFHSLIVLSSKRLPLGEIGEQPMDDKLIFLISSFNRLYVSKFLQNTVTF